MSRLSVYHISRARKFFIISIVSLPILFMYATPIPGFTLGDAILIFSWIILLFKEKGIEISKILIPAILYVIFITFYCLLEGSLARPTTSLRYIVYLIILLFLPTVDKDKEYAYKVLDRVGLFVMILLYIQYIALKTAGIIVPGVLTFLPLQDESLQNYNEGFNIAGRCMSVFAEPSHYAIFIILFLSYRLFLEEGLSFKKLIIPLLASISIVFCSSFTGMIMMMTIWGVKLINEIKRGNLSFAYFISGIIVFSVVFYITMKTSAGSYVTNTEVYERQSMGRFSGYDYILNEITKSGTSLFWGNGMNDIGKLEYLPGWPRLLYYYGIIGSLIYVFSFYRCTKWNTLSMVLIIVVAGLMVGTEMNFGPLFLPYMLLITLSNKSLYIKRKYDK